MASWREPRTAGVSPTGSSSAPSSPTRPRSGSPPTTASQPGDHGSTTGWRRQDSGNLGPGRAHPVRGAESLHADVVGAALPVRGPGGRGRRAGGPRDQRDDQPVAPPAGDVGGPPN